MGFSSMGEINLWDKYQLFLLATVPRLDAGRVSIHYFT
jgi:hypothetical protein